MAIKRKPDNETAEQKHERLMKEAVANHATRSEKTSWGRKRLNLEKLINKELRSREERILQLQHELQPYYDQVKEMRSEMVETCIHPFDHLVVLESGGVHCKFCNKTMAKVASNDG